MSCCSLWRIGLPLQVDCEVWDKIEDDTNVEASNDSVENSCNFME